MGKIKEFQLNVDNELQELYERIGFNNVPVNHQQILTYVCLKIMDSNNINHWINDKTEYGYIRKDKKWISIYSQNFSKREQAIANYLRNSINCSIKKFYK